MKKITSRGTDPRRWDARLIDGLRWAYTLGAAHDDDDGCWLDIEPGQDIIATMHPSDAGRAVMLLLNLAAGPYNADARRVAVDRDLADRAREVARLIEWDRRQARRRVRVGDTNAARTRHRQAVGGSLGRWIDRRTIAEWWRIEGPRLRELLAWTDTSAAAGL
jgi:hypothetical protein